MRNMQQESQRKPIPLGDSEGTNMDYKKETIEILQKVNDDSLLEFFYRFIARVLKNRGY